MNLDLLEQVDSEQTARYPEEWEGTLDCVAHLTVAAFNRRGSVLAVGGNDGKIFIWDFVTRTISKTFGAHVSTITSLSWSRNSKLLASTSNDCYMRLWDVLSGECIIQWHFTTPIFSVQFSPRNDKILLVRRIKGPSMLVRYGINAEGKAYSMNHAFIPCPTSAVNDEETDLYDVVSSFDRRGEYIYSGNSKGRIQVVQLKPDSLELTVVTSFRVSNSAVKQIEFAPKKKDLFLVNSSDRIIRLYYTSHVFDLVNDSTANNTARGRKNQTGGNIKEIESNSRPEFFPEPVQKLQDLVNRAIWKKCCFSGDAESEFICAASAKENKLYIWERFLGGLSKILHGTIGEVLNELVWHPARPILVSIASGVGSIWSQTQIENWSAFAPDFKELEENCEYEERESEFDEMDEDRSPARVDQDVIVEEETDIDVVKPSKIDIFLSSDEEQEDPDALIYFPATIEIDDADMDYGEEDSLSLFEEGILLDKENKKSRQTNSPKPLQPKNRNTPTVDI